MKWWGRVLDGHFAHWCYDWDDLPIDETCDEWDTCTCRFVVERDSADQKKVE